MIQRRKLLQEAIRLAEEVEHGLDMQTRDPVKQYAFGSIVFARRYTQAILTLGTEFAAESVVLERTLEELWVNTQWIFMADSRKRSLRFMRFEPLDRLDALDKIPSAKLDKAGKSIISKLRRERAKTRHLFRYERKGKRKWATHWAISGKSIRAKLIDRVNDIAGADSRITSGIKGARTFTTLYARYAQLSVFAHPNQAAMTPFLDVALDGRLMANREPWTKCPTSKKSVTAILLDILGFTIFHFDLADHKKQLSLLLERNSKLPDVN